MTEDLHITVYYVCFTKSYIRIRNWCRLANIYTWAAFFWPTFLLSRISHLKYSVTVSLHIYRKHSELQINSAVCYCSYENSGPGVKIAYSHIDASAKEREDTPWSIHLLGRRSLRMTLSLLQFESLHKFASTPRLHDLSDILLLLTVNSINLRKLSPDATENAIRHERNHQTSVHFYI